MRLKLQEAHKHTLLLCVDVLTLILQSSNRKELFFVLLFLSLGKESCRTAASGAGWSNYYLPDLTCLLLRSFPATQGKHNPGKWPRSPSALTRVQKWFHHGAAAFWSTVGRSSCGKHCSCIHYAERSLCFCSFIQMFLPQIIKTQHAHDDKCYHWYILGQTEPWWQWEALNIPLFWTFLDDTGVETKEIGADQNQFSFHGSVCSLFGHLVQLSHACMMNGGVIEARDFVATAGSRTHLCVTDNTCVFTGRDHDGTGREIWSK